MDRRVNLTGTVFAGVYLSGLAVALVVASEPELRPVRVYLAGLPWSMATFGLGFGLPPSAMGWVLMLLAVCLNAIIAYAWGVFVAEVLLIRRRDTRGQPRAPSRVE